MEKQYGTTSSWVGRKGAPAGRRQQGRWWWQGPAGRLLAAPRHAQGEVQHLPCCPELPAKCPLQALLPGAGGLAQALLPGAGGLALALAASLPGRRRRSLAIGQEEYTDRARAAMENMLHVMEQKFGDITL